MNAYNVTVYPECNTNVTVTRETINVSNVSLAASKSREEREREPSTTRATGPPESAP